MDNFTPKPHAKSSLTEIYHYLAKHGIICHHHKKAIKHAYLRPKIDGLHISTPYGFDDDKLAYLLYHKLNWIEQAFAHYHAMQQDINKPIPDTLWGKVHSFNNLEDKLNFYRQALQKVIPDLCQKWQPIVGKTAHSVRIKKMHSRFGTCNSRQARIWLSLYLPAYDYRCTEYVFVHELCHLHHANHSLQFWQMVEHAMPDYREWHNYLKQQNLRKVGL